MLYDRDRYDSPVVRYWPGFSHDASHPRHRITLRQVLSHSSGLHLAVPPDVTPQTITDLPRMMELLSNAEPAFEPGTKAAQALLSQGVIIAAVLKQECGVDLSAAFIDRVARPLRVQEDVFLGGIAAAAITPDRIARLANGFAAQIKALMGDGVAGPPGGEGASEEKGGAPPRGTGA
jgi:CubicO group peptidase (beta-lactamase class C family)